MGSILEVESLMVRFGGLVALDSVSCQVEEGTVSSLIGPNGAGKTTLFNVVAGAISPQRGRVVFADKDITRLREYEVCRRGISRTYQQRNIFPHLSVYENVAAGMLKDRGRIKTRDAEVRGLLDFVGLAEKWRAVASELSALQMKLVELGRALATRPRLLLLDELIGGLLPPETAHIGRVVRLLRDDGYTVLQIGHEIGPIMGSSDMIIVLNRGRKIAEGTPSEIEDNELVQTVYLEADEHE